MFDLIINPVAGGKANRIQKKNIAIIERCFKKHNTEFSMHFTTEKGRAKTLTEELIQKGATDIICVGGDGTLHEILNGFSNFENVNLGLIPCGTGNDFANALNLPLNIEKSIDLILDGSAKYTDFLQLPTVRCMNIAGVGIDVEVLKRYEALKKKTKLGYTKCLIRSFFGFEYAKFNAKSEVEDKNYTSFIACVANGISYGGRLPICPPAKVDDGLLDFVAIKEIKKYRFVSALLKLKTGKILSLKESVHYTAKEIKISPNTPCTVNVDGELYENIPFDVKVVHNTLKMYR